MSQVETANGEGFLINGQGDVIAHSNSQNLYQNIGDYNYELVNAANGAYISGQWFAAADTGCGAVARSE